MPQPDPIDLLARLPTSRPALIDAGARLLVTDPDAARRILTDHHPADAGRCARCGRTWWPCIPVNMALAARILIAGRPLTTPPGPAPVHGKPPIHDHLLW